MGTITDATFAVVNYAVSTDAIYSVYSTDLDASAVVAHTETHTRFTAGTLIGSLAVTAADSNASSVLTLNAAGVAWLNSQEDSLAILSGSSTGATFSHGSYQSASAVLNIRMFDMPEPSSALLIGSALCGIIRLCRKSRG